MKVVFLYERSLKSGKTELSKRPLDLYKVKRKIQGPKVITHVSHKILNFFL